MTEKVVKLVADNEGVLQPQEALRMTMPTELRKPNFTPAGQLILLDPIPAKEQVTTAGIILPATDKTHKAYVVRVGKYVQGYKRGDLVMLNLLPPPCMIEGHAYVLENDSVIAGKYEPFKEEKTKDENRDKESEG